MKRNGAVVILSGGQDSTTALFWAKTEYDRVHALTINYGQRHAIEIQSAKMVAKMAGVEDHRVSAFPTLGHVVGGNTQLLDSSKGDVSQQHNLDENLPASFVPGRNYFLMGFGMVYAYCNNLEAVITGVSQRDYSGYPDCREA